MMLMNTTKLNVAIFSTVLILPGCATVIGTDTSFKAWQGNEVYKGKGGTLEIFDEVEFWENGEPNKEYVIVGLVSQEKSEGTLDDLLFGKFNNQQIIDIVKREDGDGVILMKGSRFVSGYSVNEYSPVKVSPKYSTSSVMAVFKYVSAKSSPQLEK